ncbi:methyltransferase family protein [Mucilaginibacter yixingensis]|uniref:Methyltransferase family protein n=1 Tax=Mucilaginibacter yixingensis TaxID=1295612 RepID=A0A2T5JB84_9SPHI|nr:class I SAM-dependent methyltransferase [Mucilaginibacter yixingensis]PTQ98127.1 methyltransferase family protein [Mucilaginibacter yixingensis]
MGSQAKQAALWGQRPGDWASIQERTCDAGYYYALNLLKPTGADTLLDIGCGTGLFCQMAVQAGAQVTGFDATQQFIEQARRRVPGIDFVVGEMEELPFQDSSFDIVTGFNSFQYAANVSNALAEAKRVLKPGGKLVTMIWGNREDCEAASFLKAIGALMPPPPPGAPGPFALTENHLLEDLLTQTGFRIIDNYDVPTPWEYDDRETALKGLLSAGPVANAIAFSGLDKTMEVVAGAIAEYVKPDGRVIYQNKFRVITSLKPQ